MHLLQGIVETDETWMGGKPRKGTRRDDGKPGPRGVRPQDPGYPRRGASVWPSLVRESTKVGWSASHTASVDTDPSRKVQRRSPSGRGGGGRILRGLEREELWIVVPEEDEVIARNDDEAGTDRQGQHEQGNESDDQPPVAHGGDDVGVP